MFTMLLAFALTFVVVAFSFAKARAFVRNRLRFVDAAQSPVAPIVAGLGAALLGSVAVALLPIVGTGTALSFGLAVGMGVAAGAKDVREGRMLHD